jgi:protocatechuate 3,4-dioxygenase beta subunit
MNPTRICLAVVLLSLFALSSSAQISAIPSQPPGPATISGIVIKDPGSQPLNKAIVELIAEDQRQDGNYTAVTGADGTFRIEGIKPGRYLLFGERTGYIERANHGGRSRGRTLTLTDGQELKDVEIRFAAAAVVSGRVTDEDGDPLENAEVTVLRRTFSSGRSRHEQVGSERTNDLGEYRVSGLAAGNYYVSASPPPDFKSLIESENTPAVGKNRPATNAEKPSTSYQTVYYPGTPDRSQAEPIQLRAGDEFPADFSLTPSTTLTIRGVVTNLPQNTSAMIMLQSNDFNVVFNGAEVHKDGSFVIHDVSPGAYTIVASVENAAVPMVALQSLQVSSNNIDGLRLVPQAGATIRGRVRWEGKTEGNPLNSGPISLTLHPSDSAADAVVDFSVGDGFSPVAQITAEGAFQWTNVPPGNYSLRLGSERNDAANWFLKSVVVGGRATDFSSISVGAGVMVLDVIASAYGGTIQGVVADPQGEPVADAVVVAAPEERSHSDRFLKTVSDQSGRFSLHGIAPGQYSLFAWDNVDGDAYYDPDFLKNYEQQAISLRIAEGEHKSLQLQVIPTAEHQ